ncbi:protein Shroom3 isoform X2 [Nematolebias whitei]|uniref:protein Shroom3 isoform X2 n=1 Tax=Nematolebias whitei TaxID=451745 RepID=UPI00189A335F|nr:protein Shroom3 isoform X2 [Nematolebias whitei]
MGNQENWTGLRDFDPGYVEEFVTSSNCSPVLRLPSPPSPVSSRFPLSYSSTPQQETQPSNHSQPCSTVQLRIKNRRTEPASRPHSWHLTKLDEGQPDFNPADMDTMSSAWTNSYPASVSTTDLSCRFEYGGGCLRKSPDQYSSRGSMESLDPPQSVQRHSTVQTQHPLGHHGHTGLHSAYSSCHQLSSARSSNSIDHLHSQRDSAYSTSSSIPEYLASTPSFSPARSYSLETVPQRGGGSAEMLQADIHNVRTSYDVHQGGLSHERELSSASATLLSSSDSRGAVRSGLNRDLQAGGVCYRGNDSGNDSGNTSGGGRSSVPASNRHSVGPIWGSAASYNSYESLKGAPAPPRRSDSYAAIRNHERPNSWSSLEHARSLRSLQKGSCHHSSGPVASVAAKGPYGLEGQLHTVMEKSPESSPTTKPRQGGGFSLPPSPTGPTSGPAGPLNGTSATENGHQNNSSPLSHSAYLPSTSSQIRTRGHEADRHQQQESNAGPHRPHGKTTGGESDCQIWAQRPQNHQGPFIQNFQVPHSQEQIQDFRVPPVYSGPSLRTCSSQEKTDPRDKIRSRDLSSVHPDPAASSRLPQGQVRPTCASPSPPQLQAPPTSVLPPCSRHLGDSSAPPPRPWSHGDPDEDSEHPLTRLENALHEVQRSASPDGVFSGGNHDNGCHDNGCHDNGGHSDGARGPVRSLSVLEKVSRFERQERGVKSGGVSHSKAPHLQMVDKGRSFPCGAEDLRNMLERSTKEAKTCRTMSYRGGGETKPGTPADPVSALQRSRSSFQLDGLKDGDTSRDFPWSQKPQEVMDPLQDPFPIRDGHSNVHRSFSFRRNNLNSSINPPPPAPPPASSSCSLQPPPIPAKEKKGPKTRPKPQGVVITPLVLSPHTPKERHVVCPDVRGQSPPPLPTVPPVGPPPLTRICGRKRLTADQKKRSYSEPENLNEVGVLDPEISALFRRGGETSVADRRKMFELAAVRGGDGAPQRTMSRSDLRQVRQDALVEYMVRKTGAKRDEGPRTGTRPRSAFLQLENSNHSDTFSLSSTSSLLSLQEPDPDHRFLSEERRLCSTLPVGADLLSLQSNLFHPGRVTTPRPPAQPVPSASALELHAHGYQELNPETAFRQSHRRNSSQDQQNAEFKPGLSQKLNEALQRAGSHRRSGRSASAENLLERSENKPYSPQHHRSRSSPTVEELNQNLMSGDVKTFGVSFSEAERCALAADSPADVHAVPPQRSQFIETTLQSPPQDPAHTPVTRRERQRNGERLRAHSTSTLAASVGLPCPFPPAGTRDGDAAEWRASERLSQANLDAISFPDVPQTDVSNRDETPVRDRQTRSSLSDVSGDAPEDEYRNRAFSLEWTGRSSEERTKPVSPSSVLPLDRKTSRSSTPPPSSHPSVRHLSSLRISESSLSGSFEPQQLRASTGTSQEDLDEVFFQNLPPPPPLTPPLKETSIVEDFPPPPPPELEAEEQIERGKSTSTTAEDNVEYQLLHKRDKSPEELRAEALARQLVLRDPSLAPLLDTWGGKSTVELMEEMFPNSRRADKTPEPLRGSTCPDERNQEGSAAREAGRREETNLDEDETDLNAAKVALCEALRSSVAALQQQKRALGEELRQHRALGSSLEVLIQDRLKTNEREKYSVFVGDLERIVHLLLSLCSRLARIDRTLLCPQRTESTAEEKDSLHHKRSLLLLQTEDARELKENLDRRQRVVHAILSGYLTEAQLRDYRRFVGAKPSLLIHQRHLDDLIRQGEEQLTGLVESLPAELAEARGWSTSCSPLAPPFVTTGSAHSSRPTTVTSL